MKASWKPQARKPRFSSQKPRCARLRGSPAPTAGRAPTGRRRTRGAALPQDQRQRQGHGQRHGEHRQRPRPARAADQPLRRRHQRELPQSADRAGHGQRPAAPFRRDQPAQRAVDDGEGGAGQGDADADPRRQHEHRRRGRERHADQAQRIENQPGGDDLGRTMAVGDHAGEGLGDAPGQVLQRHGHGEGFARPAPVHADRQQEQPLHMAHAQGQAMMTPPASSMPTAGRA